MIPTTCCGTKISCSVAVESASSPGNATPRKIHGRHVSTQHPETVELNVSILQRKLDLKKLVVATQVDANTIVKKTSFYPGGMGISVITTTT